MFEHRDYHRLSLPTKMVDLSTIALIITGLAMLVAIAGLILGILAALQPANPGPAGDVGPPGDIGPRGPPAGNSGPEPPPGVNIYPSVAAGLSALYPKALNLKQSSSSGTATQVQVAVWDYANMPPTQPNYPVNTGYSLVINSYGPGLSGSVAVIPAYGAMIVVYNADGGKPYGYGGLMVQWRSNSNAGPMIAALPTEIIVGMTPYYVFITPAKIDSMQ
jgi:hypothetical protein